MKRLIINIPTNMTEFKEFMMNKCGWMTHRGRMKKNEALLNKLCNNLCDEINSNYWSKDISDYMKRKLTGDNGNIKLMVYNAKKKLV